MPGGCRVQAGPAVPGTEALPGLQGPRSTGTAGEEARGAPAPGRAGQSPGARQGSTAVDAGEASTSPLEKRQVPSQPGLFSPSPATPLLGGPNRSALPASAGGAEQDQTRRSGFGWKFPSSAAPPPQKSPGLAVYARRRRRRRSLAAPADPPP